MVNMGWDEDIWCFGYGKPVFCGDGYIRVVYSNVEGANNDSDPSGFKVGSDGFTLKIPYRAGYTFEGWYTDAAFTNKITEVKGLTTPLKVIYRLDDEISFRKCSLFDGCSTDHGDCTNFHKKEIHFSDTYFCNQEGIHFHCTKLFEAMYDELPLPKQKRKNNGAR